MLGTHPEVFVQVFSCERRGLALFGQSKVYESVRNCLSNFVQAMFATLSKVNAFATMPCAFRVLANGVENHKIKIGNCEGLALGHSVDQVCRSPSSTLTSGHRFLPCPTIPPRPRPRAARISSGTWIEWGFWMPASTSFPFAMP